MIRRVLLVPLMVAVLFCLAGCQQDMARPPSYRPLEPSAFFPDGRSARPLVPGTVHRGAQFVTGKKPTGALDQASLAGVIAQTAANPLGATGSLGATSPYLDAFPFKVTKKVLDRGQERYNIYCAVCHDRVGTGQGMIVQRGFTPPPSFHTDLSRGFKLRGIQVKLTDAPVGYYFEVITDGFGAMPDYAVQIPPDDRWAIIAYIRALQLSQAATLQDVRDENQKTKLLQSRGQQP